MTTNYTGTTHSNTTPDGTTDQIKHKAGDIKDQAQHKAGEMASEYKEKAFSMVDSQKERAADQIHSVAEAIRSSSQHLRDQDNKMMAGAVNQGAEQLDRLAGYLREKDINQLWYEVDNLAHRRPEIFLGGALLLGFIGARFLKSSREEAYRQGRNYGYSAYGARGNYGSYQGSSYAGTASSDYGTDTSRSTGTMGYAPTSAGTMGTTGTAGSLGTTGTTGMTGAGMTNTGTTGLGNTGSTGSTGITSTPPTAASTSPTTLPSTTPAPTTPTTSTTPTTQAKTEWKEDTLDDDKRVDRGEDVNRTPRAA